MNIAELLTGRREVADVAKFVDTDGVTKRALVATLTFDEYRKRVQVLGSEARPADATAYAVGDIIANSLTAALVVPITFPAATRRVNGSGEVLGARATVTAASGTIVLPAFDLMLFRPVTNIPFAAAGYPADNTALNLTQVAMEEQVAVYSFLSTTWRNQIGGTTAAGTVIYQSVSAQAGGRISAPFSLAGTGFDYLLGLVVAQNTWTPLAVINTLRFTLDIVQD